MSILSGHQVVVQTSVRGALLVALLGLNCTPWPGTSNPNADGGVDDTVAIQVRVSAGGRHTCAITTLGQAFCSGFNFYGQLGDGTTTQRSTPVLVSGPADLRFTHLAAGKDHTCGVTTGGTIMCWGRNRQYDQAMVESRTNPVRVVTPKGVKFTDVVTGSSTGEWNTPGNDGSTCGLTTAGEVYCWDSNAFSQLGDGLVEQTPAVQISAPMGATFTQVSANRHHACAVTTAGEAYCWGHNNLGQVGVPVDTTDWERPVIDPVLVSAPAGTRFTQVAAGGGIAVFYGQKLFPPTREFSCGLTTSGVVLCWGDNMFGQLGTGGEGEPKLGNGRFNALPIENPARLTFTHVSTGDTHMCAVATTGSVYCWGSDNDGQLGDGDPATVRWTAVQVAAPTGVRFTQVSAGTSHTCGVTTASEVYCWGNPADGALGVAQATSSAVLFLPP